MGKKILRIAAGVLCAVLLAVALLIGALSITEYRPGEEEDVPLMRSASGTLRAGESIKVLTWNIGYGALGDNADFFMDGGSEVYTADEARVRENMEGIVKTVTDISPDLMLFQETDRNSARSYHVDETAVLRSAAPGYCSSFANNFKVSFLPYPIPPIGKVDSGLLTLSSFYVSGSKRIQLPIPFPWPIRMANLKRCLLVSRIPMENGKELVLINLHLEAYDDGEGKAAQTEMLGRILGEEAAKGNYVIAAGDFNQIFSNADTGRYPAQEGKWQAGQIDISSFPGGWQFLMDAETPSCRSLDQPYAGADKETFQYYLIDGFILSGNVRAERVETMDLGFVWSDHNPVLAEVVLIP